MNYNNVSKSKEKWVDIHIKNKHNKQHTMAFIYLLFRKIFIVAIRF